MADEPEPEAPPLTGDGSSLTDVERMLMAQYDIESDAPPQTPAVSTPLDKVHSLNHEDMTSLDATVFSVEAWLESRKDLGLDMLLQQQKALRADITRFKNSTQTLVHDNYSRFIAAADIIRTMRGEFEGMVVDTKELTARTQGATSASEAMNSRLQVGPAAMFVRCAAPRVLSPSPLLGLHFRVCTLPVSFRGTNNNGGARHRCRRTERS